MSMRDDKAVEASQTMLAEFKETQESMQLIRSKLRNIGKFKYENCVSLIQPTVANEIGFQNCSEFVRKLIEDIFAASGLKVENSAAETPTKYKRHGKRADLVALKELSLTLANMNKILSPME